MADTHIEWTRSDDGSLGKTWNPVAGCSIVSAGCIRCYAMRMAARLEAMGQSKYIGLTQKVNGNTVWTGDMRFDEEALMLPLRWKKPARIFVNSMSDCFHEGVTDEQLDQIFAVMALCPQHVFQILTKRPGRMHEYLLFRGGSPPPAGSCADITPAMVQRAAVEMVKASDAAARGSAALRARGWRWPLPNCWLGVSCENQETADARIPLLLETPAAVRFISAEPLLGAVDLMAFKSAGVPDWWQGNLNPMSRLGWVIVGGESGPDSRPMALEWARSLRDQCQAAGIAYFFKQWGASCPFTYTGKSGQFIGQNGEVSYCDKGQVHEWDEKGYHLSVRVGKKRAGRLLDGREWNEFPQGVV